MIPKLNATARLFQCAYAPNQVSLSLIVMRQASIEPGTRRWQLRPDDKTQKAIQEAQRQSASRPDTLVTISMRSTPIADESVNDIITRGLNSLERLRTEGGAKQWLDLVVLVRYLVAIQLKAMVLIDTRVIVNAYDALFAIRVRHCDELSGTWTQIKMLAPEIAYLDKAIHHNGAQLLHLTHAQFNEAYDLGRRWTFANLSAAVERIRSGLQKELKEPS